MPTEKDVQIFVCGVTQYAMSSGKFEADDILKLTERAHDAFCAVFGKPAPEAAPRQSPSPGSSWSGGRVVNPNYPATNIPLETKPYEMWGGDKAYFGKNGDFAFGFPIRDVDWSTWLDQAANGDPKAKRALEIMAKGTLGDDPKWHRANAQKIGRAKVCLQKLAEGYQAPAAMEGPPPQETPF